MAAYNDVTGHALISKVGNKEAQDKFNANFDAIFGVKPKKEKYVPPLPLNEYLDNSSDEWDEKRADTIGQNGNDGLHYD